MEYILTVKVDSILTIPGSPDIISATANTEYKIVVEADNEEDAKNAVLDATEYAKWTTPTYAITDIKINE